MNWIVLLISWLATDDKVTFGEAMLPPKSKVTIESRSSFDLSIGPASAPLMRAERRDSVACTMTVQLAERLKSYALVRFSEHSVTMGDGGSHSHETHPVEGRGYWVGRTGNDLTITRDKGTDRSLPDRIEDEEKKELRVFSDFVTFGSALIRVFKGKPVSTGTPVSLALEDALVLFGPPRFGKIESCTLELLERRKVGKLDCAVFKVALSAVDGTIPELPFVVLLDLRGELVVTIAHAFPVSCTLKAPAKPHPRKGAEGIDMSMAPSGTREWTWSAKIE